MSLESLQFHFWRGNYRCNSSHVEDEAKTVFTVKDDQKCLSVLESEKVVRSARNSRKLNRQYMGKPSGPNKDGVSEQAPGMRGGNNR